MVLLINTVLQIDFSLKVFFDYLCKFWHSSTTSVTTKLKFDYLCKVNEMEKDSTTELNLVDKQDDPQKNMIPATEDELSQIISMEANYDRWSNFLFPHVKSKDLYGRRKRTWSIDLPDGQTSEAQIEIIPAQDERCYTDKTYDVFLALMEIWQDLMMPDVPMELFIGDVAKKLDLKENGRVVAMIIEELRCLEETKVSWIFSFQTAQTREDTYKNQRVLDTFDYVQKKERVKGVTKTRCLVRFSEHIRNNFKNKITIPINFSARKKIRSSIAKTLYNRIDNILAKNPVHERTALGLVGDLNIPEGRYKHKSQRLELVQRLQRNLDGIELSRLGVFLSVDIKETSDGKDWKCIFKKRGESSVVPRSKPRLPIVNPDGDTREYLIDLIASVVGSKEKNYGLYNTFALHYAENMIHRAIGEYKELTDINPNIANKESYFTALMHTIAHKLNKDWIKPCDKTCRYRPENQLFPDV